MDNVALAALERNDATRAELERAMVIVLRRWGLEALVSGSWQPAA